MRAIISMAALSMCAAASGTATAQEVFKCGARTYSQVPCSRRVVNTVDAPVPVKQTSRDWDVRRTEQNRVIAQSLRRLPGETDADFATRRHRARMLTTDRDECARLDTRIPFEQARMQSPHEDEVSEAQAALSESRKRFRQLKC